MTFDPPSADARAALAPHGRLRAAINLRNFLLVTATAANGDPVGVSPDVAAELAALLEVPLELIRYETPAGIADDAGNDAWDIGNIGATAIRAETISFSPPYAEIEATYLVRDGSPLQHIADVDATGVTIAVSARTAYDNWLDRNLTAAELHRAEGNEATAQLFADGNHDALAGLRPRLLTDQQAFPGSRLLPGRFTAVQQAIGTPRGRHQAGADYLEAFVNHLITTERVAQLIEHHEVVGLSAVGS